jgi:hypothetical protein
LILANSSNLCPAGADIDYSSQQEGTSATISTVAVITSRSYHSGIVNSALVDGSVRSMANSIDLRVWRALGTRQGGEVATLD